MRSLLLLFCFFFWGGWSSCGKHPKPPKPQTGLNPCLWSLQESSYYSGSLDFRDTPTFSQDRHVGVRVSGLRTLEVSGLTVRMIWVWCQALLLAA